MTLEAWHSCGVIPRIPSAAFRIYAMHLKPFIFEGTTKWIEQLYCKQSKWDWIQFSCCCFVDGRPCVFCCPPTQLKASSCIFLSNGSKQPQLYSPCTRHTGHIYIHISISLEWPSIAASQSRIMPFVCWIKLHWLRQCAMVKSIMHLRHRSHGRTRHTDENGDKNTMFYLHFAAWGATERKSPQHRWRKKGHTFVTVSLCVCVCTTVEDNSRAISNDDTMYAYVEDVLRYFLLDLQQYMWPGFFFAEEANAICNGILKVLDAKKMCRLHRHNVWTFSVGYCKSAQQSASSCYFFLFCIALWASSERATIQCTRYRLCGGFWIVFIWLATNVKWAVRCSLVSECTDASLLLLRMRLRSPESGNWALFQSVSWNFQCGAAVCRRVRSV